MKAQSSVVLQTSALADTTDPLIREINNVGLTTLKECMQTVYEDGPKRDYAYHYVLEALLKCNMNKEARSLLLNYWGNMVEKGADTFWEVFDPKNDFISPYNFYPINSYCHAWSCTPVYFINKYPEVFQSGLK